MMHVMVVERSINKQLISGKFYGTPKCAALATSPFISLDQPLYLSLGCTVCTQSLVSFSKSCTQRL